MVVLVLRVDGEKQHNVIKAEFISIKCLVLLKIIRI